MPDRTLAAGSDSLFYRRHFLNQPGFHSGAYVLAEIAAEPASDTFAGVVDGYLTIADCDRRATLRFTAHSPEQTANSVEKAQRLRDDVDAFVEAFLAAVDGQQTQRRRVA